MKHWQSVAKLHYSGSEQFDDRQHFFTCGAHVMGMVNDLVFEPGPEPGNDIRKEPVLVFEISVYTCFGCSDFLGQFFKREIFKPHFMDHQNTMLHNTPAQRRLFGVAEVQLRVHFNLNLEVHKNEIRTKLEYYNFHQIYLPFH